MKVKHRLKVKRWKKIFHANGNEKNTSVEILISDKIDVKGYSNKEGHYIMIKGHNPTRGCNHCKHLYTQERSTYIQYIKQTLMDVKGEINNNTVTGILRPS